MVSNARGTGTWTNIKFLPTRDLIHVKCPGRMGILGFDSYIREVQTNFLMLRTVAKMQNDVGMTSQIVYFQFVSLFGNNFTKIRYKFDEKTSFSRKMV